MRSIMVWLMTIFFLLSASAALGVRYGEKLCKQNPNFTCVKVKRGQTWNSLWSNPYERDLIQRINRTNNPLHPGQILAIPVKDNYGHYMNYAPFTENIEAQNKKTIIVDPEQLAFGAYNENGDLVHWGPVSAGKGYCPDVQRACVSPKGSFQIYTKQGESCVSTKYPIGEGGAPMPYCMFFHGGFALHGSYDIPGYNASHGCIRMFKEDARWLNQEFIDMPGNGGTRVIVKPYTNFSKV